MLHIILNHLKSKAEELLSEEQAGVRAGWNTVEQIFNCRVLIEKHLQPPKGLVPQFHLLQESIWLGMAQWPVQFSYTTNWVSSSRCPLVLDRGAYSPQHSSTCFWRESCKKPFTPTPLSPLVADLSVTYTLQMILTPWQAVTLSCKNSPTNSLQQPVHMEWR